MNSEIAFVIAAWWHPYEEAPGLLIYFQEPASLLISSSGIKTLYKGWVSPELYQKAYSVYEENRELISAMDAARHWIVSGRRGEFAHDITSRLTFHLVKNTQDELINLRDGLILAEKQSHYLERKYGQVFREFAAKRSFPGNFFYPEYSEEISVLQEYCHIQDKEGYVYVLPVDDKNGKSYKIGKTIAPDSRVKTFGIELPYYNVEFSHLIETPNLSRAEKVLHRYFRSRGKGLRGEWFNLDENDLSKMRGFVRTSIKCNYFQK